MPRYIVTFRRECTRGTKHRVENARFALVSDSPTAVNEEVRKILLNNYQEDPRIQWDWSPILPYVPVPNSFRLDEEEPLHKEIRSRQPEDRSLEEVAKALQTDVRGVEMYEQRNKLVFHFDENDEKYYDGESVRSLINEVFGNWRWGM